MPQEQAVAELLALISVVIEKLRKSVVCLSGSERSYGITLLESAIADIDRYSEESEAGKDNSLPVSREEMCSRLQGAQDELRLALKELGLREGESNSE